MPTPSNLHWSEVLSVEARAGFEVPCNVGHPGSTCPHMPERRGVPHGHVMLDTDEGCIWIHVPFESREGLERLLEILQRPDHSLFRNHDVRAAILGRPELAQLPTLMSDAERTRFETIERMGGFIRYIPYIPSTVS